MGQSYSQSTSVQPNQTVQPKPASVTSGLGNSDLLELLGFDASAPSPAHEDHYWPTFLRELADNYGVPPAPPPPTLAGLLAKPVLSPEEIAQARAFIEKLPAAVQAPYYCYLQTKPGYENERNNETDLERADGGSCNLSALAMCLASIGVSNPDPSKQYPDALDAIRVQFNYGDARDGQTFRRIAEHLGRRMVELPPGVHPRAWWFSEIRNKGLGAGGACMLSINGHLARLQGVSTDGLVADDPYGRSVLCQGKEHPEGAGDATRRAWGDKNGTIADGADGSNVGADNLWPWVAVEAFAFRSIRMFY